MNFGLSPFWGGVLAVTFYQLIFTNPISFLSMGLGIVIGFGLSLYVIGHLMVRGYISMTKQVVESIGNLFRKYPMVSGIFSKYISDLFKTVYPTPQSLSSFPFINTNPRSDPGTPYGRPSSSSPSPPSSTPPPDIDISGIFDIFKNLNINISSDSNEEKPAKKSEGEKDEKTAEEAGEKDEKTAEEPKVEENQEEPCKKVLEPVDDIPESCRGVHGVDPAEEPAQILPPEAHNLPLPMEGDSKKEPAEVASPPRKRTTRSLLSDKPCCPTLKTAENKSDEPKPSGAMIR
uniref:Uncharacterized protein n=1 Tax=Marseillevirus LCMAC101 TaxID=2506602 RepID=A0A481YTV9_9VIRU|nr:MAG: hypothetical protein LCMAC101_05490 [Marseillevirus LCMAC101]